MSKRGNWRQMTVASVCKKVSVGIVVQPAQYYTREDSGVRAFRSTNIGEGRINDRDWVYISKDGHKKNKKSELKIDDVLVIRSGAPGTSCVVPEEYAGSNCIDLVFARPKTEIILPEFLCLFTNSDIGKKQITATQGGLALKHFNVGAYKKLMINIPDISEQIAITGLLSTWDQVIEKTSQLLVIKEKQLRVLYQKCFQPGTSINNSWKSKKISEYLKPRNVKLLPSEEIPLYSLTIENGVTAKTDRYNRDFLVKDNNSKIYKVVYPGDIVFNPANLRWGAIARSEINHKVVISPIYEVLEICKEVVDPELLTHALTCPRQIAIFASKTEGTLIERMAAKLDAFLLTEILLPETMEEQREIALLLDTAKQEIGFLKKQANAYRQQKHGLMQKLLTGKWRVKLKEEPGNG